MWRLAPPHSKIVLVHQVVADHAVSPIYREASDADLCVPLSTFPNMQNIKVRYIPGQCHEKEAKSPEDL